MPNRKNYLFPFAGLISFLLFMPPSQGGHPKNHSLAWFFQEKAQKYLIKNDTLNNWFEINEDGVYMYASPSEKQLKNPEFVLRWDELNTFRSLIKESPEDSAMKHYFNKKNESWKDPFSLESMSKKIEREMGRLDGLRIAIDPGHVGGEEAFARMEKKYMRMKADPGIGIPDEIAFNEGNLTMATAFELADSLEKLGATVLLTRKGYGLTAFDIPFDEWLTQSYASALEDYIKDRQLTATEEAAIRKKTKREEIFHSVFKHSEFEERANKIQAFHPDLILAIHFNVGESNTCDASGFFKPITDNYCMTFVPGAWASGELDLPQMRYEFLANLLSDPVEYSIKFSEAVTRSFEKNLKVKAMEWDSTIDYLNDFSLLTSETGVFCRNLAFNRMIHGVICFGETLYQDNIKECVLLNEKTVNYHGWMGPPRVRECAMAYLNGIVDYLK